MLKKSRDSEFRLAFFGCIACSQRQMTMISFQTLQIRFRVLASWRVSAVVMLISSAAIAICGCGDGGAQQKMDAAAQSVQTSLDTWKRGDPVASLKTSATPIEFFDDDCERAARLVEFEIKKTYMETDGTARCAVGLVVQHGAKPPEQLQVTYQVVTKDNKTVIARDPFS